MSQFFFVARGAFSFGRLVGSSATSSTPFSRPVTPSAPHPVTASPPPAPPLTRRASSQGSTQTREEITHTETSNVEINYSQQRKQSKINNQRKQTTNPKNRTW
jgi:hypothetical protein